ncbi:MAG: protein kinase [Ghiorsea sp.]
MSDTPKPNNQTEELSNLGPYVIESRLGQGGMGIVYCATDKDLGRQIAVKVLHPHLLRHENLKQRFRREARMHAKLMHPNIVTLLSLFEDDEHMALVMELVHGNDLKEHLRKNPNLSLKEKLVIATDVLSGLNAAHQFGMVHRDLKPANVLVSNKGEVKLVDFGLAKPEEGEEDLTQSGATVGSFRYMAPEQILNKPVDARTDLYAYGILLFYMSVGKLPFDATNNGGEFEIMEKQVREPAPSPRKLNSKIPVALSNLILRLLDKQKSNRPLNAIEVQDEIKVIIEGLGESPKNIKKITDNSVTTLSSPSNSEVARQWLKHGSDNFQSISAIATPLLKTFFSGLRGVAFLFVILGFVVIAIINMSENTDFQKTSKSQITTSKEVLIAEVEKPLTKPETSSTKVSNPQSEIKVITPKVAQKPKPTAKKVTPKKIASVKKVQPEKKIDSVTSQTRYKVVRSDQSTVNTKGVHEFHGGKHVFFPDLKPQGWLSSYKSGDTTIEFEQPISISEIVINKASVGRKPFKHGYVYLEVKAPSSSRWLRIFKRMRDDVDIKVRVQNIQKKMPLISSVRLRFKTTHPITVGPIDLLP